MKPTKSLATGLGLLVVIAVSESAIAPGALAAEPVTLTPGLSLPADGSELFDSFAASASGRLHLLVNRESNLRSVYRSRTPNGPWVDDPQVPDFAETLLVDPDGRAHVFYKSGNAFAHWQLDDNGWTALDSIIAPPPDASEVGMGGFIPYRIRFGADGALHVVSPYFHSEPNVRSVLTRLVYGTNRGGTWSWATIERDVQWMIAPVLAIDQQGAAHYAYTILEEGVRYLSNRTGTWRAEWAARNPNALQRYGETGLSLAVSRGGAVAIATSFERIADSGSLLAGELRYLFRNSNGSWGGGTVANRSDGYVGGDGNIASGFNATLQFDSLDRPHIAFTDFAAQHIDGNQSNLSGQIRHAYWDGSRWSIRTLLHQGPPLLVGIWEGPLMAISPAEIALVARQIEVDAPYGFHDFNNEKYALITLAVDCPGGACNLAPNGPQLPGEGDGDSSGGGCSIGDITSRPAWVMWVFGLLPALMRRRGSRCGP